MNVRTARRILRAYRPGDDERPVKEALKVARRTPALDAEFRNQLAFDNELAALLDVDPSPEVSAELEAAARRLEGARTRRSSFRDPAMLAVGVSFLALVALLVWMLMGRLGSFEGMQEVVEMVRQGDKARAADFDEIDAKAGALPDWFVMQSFDGYVVPHGMENAPVIGVRVMNYEDTPVAVAAVSRPKSLCYAFDVSAFGISIPKGEWRFVSYGPGNRKALAVTQLGQIAFVLALREGGRAELEQYVRSLQ